MKKTAPALRQLAESEAGFQRFDSALEKLDAALKLDPALPGAWWRRAWILLGKEDYAGAATAIRTAQAKDGAHPEWAKILPAVEQLATVEESQRWTPERAQIIYDHLMKVGASGELVALSAKMRLAAKQNSKLVRVRLDEWLGKDVGHVQVRGDGLIEVHNLPRSIKSLGYLQGLPIGGLSIEDSAVTDLEPLRDMRLTWIDIRHTDVDSLEPLKGMPLKGYIGWGYPKITDFSPLKDMPLKEFYSLGSVLHDLSFLAGAPLEKLQVEVSRFPSIEPLRGKPLKELIIRNCDAASLDALANAPLEILAIGGSFTDISALRGKPLRELDLGGKVSDISALRGAPIKSLKISHPLSDCRQLLDLPKLETLEVHRDQTGLEVLKQHPTLRFIRQGQQSPIPVAEFWKEYDARKAAGQK